MSEKSRDSKKSVRDADAGRFLQHDRGGGSSRTGSNNKPMRESTHKPASPPGKKK